MIDSGAVDPDDPKQIARYIYKVHIPNQGRLACLSMLRRMNIHHANLFPDPSGASEYCNDWLRREIAEARREEAAKKIVETKIPSLKPVEQGPPPAVVGAAGSVAEIIKALIVDDDGIAEATIAEWAGRVAKTYKEHASLDWPVHVSGQKEVTVRIRRLMNALGFPEARREAAVSAIVDFYAKEYRAQHGLADPQTEGGLDV